MRTIGVSVIAITVVAWCGLLLLLGKSANRQASKSTNRQTGGLANRLVLMGGRVWRWIPAILSGLIHTPYQQLALNMALSFIGFAVFYGQAFVLLQAFWVRASWMVVPYFPIITLSTILPIAVGGVGIREWTAILLLRQFGVTESVAFNTFFAHFVVVQLLPALVGVAIIGSFRRGSGAVGDRPQQ